VPEASRSPHLDEYGPRGHEIADGASEHDDAVVRLGDGDEPVEVHGLHRPEALGRNVPHRTAARRSGCRVAFVGGPGADLRGPVLENVQARLSDERGHRYRA
jgi:hypothetical protein